MRRILTSVVVAASIMAAGAPAEGLSGPRWVQPGYAAGQRNENAGESRVTAANVAGLEEAWRASVDPRPSQPVVADGTVVVAAGTTTRAYRLTDGMTRWSTTATEVGTGIAVYRSPTAAVELRRRTGTTHGHLLEGSPR